MMFSQRTGYKSISKTIQKEGMDEDLRNSIYNAVFEFYPEHHHHSLYLKIWTDFYKYPISRFARLYQEDVKNHILTAAWFEVYDLIEFIVENTDTKPIKQKFIEKCNLILERESSAYRFVDGLITEITSEEEIKTIDESINDSPSNVETHLKNALILLSDKKEPDYRNSIKESISAVESICKLIVNDKKTTLGWALKKIEEESKIDLHPSLKAAFKSLYDYTNDADGIRHALKEESNLNYEDAKFMLVSCSAFINYLIVKSSKNGIKLEYS